ncbi:MAG: TolC family protein [Campylobacterota bacterium]
MKVEKVVRFYISFFILSIILAGCSISPEPLLPKEIEKAVKKDLQTINDNSPRINKPITLDQAMKMAIENNLNSKVKIMESALMQKEIKSMYYEMLPSLMAKAGYSSRDKYAASASTSFTDGVPDALGDDPNYSISANKNKMDADVTFNWNILDFGLSYVRAQQKSNRYLMAKEKERKAIQNIIQEVRKTYYEVVLADALLKRIKPMKKEVQEALADLNKAKELRVGSPMKSLSYKRELLEVLRSLQALQKNLVGAKVKLSELMGLKPGIDYELHSKIKKDYELPNLNLRLDEMEKIALRNRPEILESRYKQRITNKETTVAILRMLPGINLSSDISYSNSDYLLNNNWSTFGTKISWNLLNIFKLGDYQDVAKAKQELAKKEKLAISMAVLSQVHLSTVRFYQAKKEYELSKRYLNVAQEIFDLTEVGNSLNMNSRLVFIKEKLNYMLATLRHSYAYANLQNSYGRIFASLGVQEQINTKNSEDIVKEGKKIQKELKDQLYKKKKPKKSKKPIKKYKVAYANENLFIRENPSESSAYKFVLQKGFKLKVLEEIENKEGEWIKTPYGFINSQKVSIKFDNLNIEYLEDYTKEDIMFIGKTTKPANIRLKPSWNAKKRVIISQNRDIKVLEVVSNKDSIWYKTPYGYISNIVVTKEVQ